MMHSSMGLAGVQWNMPVLSYLQPVGRIGTHQAKCPSYSLHDRLFKVNVHEIVHNLALLLDLELESRGGYYG